MQDFAIPDFIPDEVLAAHAKDARRTVTRSRNGRHAGVVRVAREAQPEAAVAAAKAPAHAIGAAHHSAVVVGALLSFLGAFAMTALWGWLAVTEQDQIWWVLMSAGVALMMLTGYTVTRSTATAVQAIRRPRRS
jgi:hypothetical protein